LAVVFDEPIEFKQKEKEKNLEKTQNEKTHKKERKTDHRDETKTIKINNEKTISSIKDAAPEITPTQSKYPPVFRG